MTDISEPFPYNTSDKNDKGNIKGRGEYAGMDDCHARYQHHADHTGHGKNYFSGKSAGYRRTALFAGKSSAERTGGEIRGIFSETGRYFLWNAVSKRLPEQQIEDEQNRTAEIDKLKKYMETDEYAEEVAREKLGLVKDNETVFKKQQ